MRRYLALTLVLLVNHNGPDPFTDEVMRGIARGDSLSRPQRQERSPGPPRYVPPPNPRPERWYGPGELGPGSAAGWYRNPNSRR